MERSRSQKISASLEDYLGTIYHLEQVNRVARAKDIADRMKVSRASVTGALRTLSNRGLVNYQPYSYITLTKRGRNIASEVLHRHNVLTDFFCQVLHMEPVHAKEVAGRVEHAIDSATVDRLSQFMSLLKVCPRTKNGWCQTYNQICQWGRDTSKCSECIDKIKL
jgi:DtxR family Mn-dependent transcriptional regulator